MNFNNNDLETQWEQRIEEYNRHLAQIETEIPPKLLRFSNELCLHDAEFLAFTPAPLLPLAGEFYGLEWTQDCYTLLARQADKLILIYYIDIMEAPSIKKPVHSEVFYPSFPIWLYDEIDLLRKNVFSHEILFSDGSILRNVFGKFLFLVLPNIHPRAVRNLDELPKGIAS